MERLTGRCFHSGTLGAGLGPFGLGVVGRSTVPDLSAVNRVLSSGLARVIAFDFVTGLERAGGFACSGAFE